MVLAVNGDSSAFPPVGGSVVPPESPIVPRSAPSTDAQHGTSQFSKDARMTPPSVDALNAEFAIPEQVFFVEGPGGLILAEVANRHAAAAVSLLGGHVMAFQPRDEKPVLWMSEESRFEVGEPIRGGIPICWPWFGAHPTDSTQPNHGFARRMLWRVLGTDACDSGESLLRLGLDADAGTRSFWSHKFQLEVEIVLGRQLGVSLLTRNTGNDSFTVTAALHSYFNVSDIRNVAVRGLEDCVYIDTVGERTRRTQRGPITFTGETDRIYLDTTAPCLIEDPGLKRCIRVAKCGSHSTVVWNPWIAKSARMPDFGDSEWPGMLCVETTNAAEDAREIEPGGQHALTAILSVEG